MVTLELYCEVRVTLVLHCEVMVTLELYCEVRIRLVLFCAVDALNLPHTALSQRLQHGVIFGSMMGH